MQRPKENAYEEVKKNLDSGAADHSKGSVGESADKKDERSPTKIIHPSFKQPTVTSGGQAEYL